MATANELQALGSRGIHVRVSNGKVDLRKFTRSTSNADALVPTQIGISLNQSEWYDLLQLSVAVSKEVQENGEEPGFTKPIGHDGVHLALNKYQGYLLVQVRKYFRPFAVPGKLLPTKEGIALKLDEWDALCNIMGNLQMTLSKTT